MGEHTKGRITVRWFMYGKEMRPITYCTASAAQALVSACERNGHTAYAEPEVTR